MKALDNIPGDMESIAAISIRVLHRKKVICKKNFEWCTRTIFFSFCVFLHLGCWWWWSYCFDYFCTQLWQMGVCAIVIIFLSLRSSYGTIVTACFKFLPRISLHQQTCVRHYLRVHTIWLSLFTQNSTVSTTCRTLWEGRKAKESLVACCKSGSKCCNILKLDIIFLALQGTGCADLQKCAIIPKYK